MVSSQCLIPVLILMHLYSMSWTATQTLQCKVLTSSYPKTTVMTINKNRMLTVDKLVVILGNNNMNYLLPDTGLKVYMYRTRKEKNRKKNKTRKNNREK